LPIGSEVDIKPVSDP